MSSISHIEQLVDDFHRDMDLAKSLESCNPQDDLVIKMAIVGFSYNSSTQDWAKDHYNMVTSRLGRDYHDTEIAEYGENGLNVKLFFALAFGFLLGQYQEQVISEDEFRLEDMQIPGIIMRHLHKITSASRVGQVSPDRSGTA
jgi:hypothetical protein